MSDLETLCEQIEKAKENDVNQSFFYHGWVVPDYKCLCMTIPKIACTTVKVTLYHLAGNPALEGPGEVHSHDIGLFLGKYSVEEIAEIFSSPEWVRFCFVRNPYDRLFSAYKSKIGNTWDTQYDWLRDAIREKFDYPLRDGRPAGMVAFRDFVRFLADVDASVRYEMKEDAIFDGHYNVQSRIMMQDLIAYDFVGRFEHLAEDFEEILTRLGAPEETISLSSEVRNSTIKVPLAAAYDRELADMAFELYKDDFEHFGYDRDSWLFDF